MLFHPQAFLYNKLATCSFPQITNLRYISCSASSGFLLLFEALPSAGFLVQQVGNLFLFRKLPICGTLPAQLPQAFLLFFEAVPSVGFFFFLPAVPSAGFFFFLPAIPSAGFLVQQVGNLFLFRKLPICGTFPTLLPQIFFSGIKSNGDPKNRTKICFGATV